MRHILARPKPGYLPLYLDLEDVDDPTEFVWRLTGEVLKQSGFARSSSGCGDCRCNWQNS